MGAKPKPKKSPDLLERLEKAESLLEARAHVEALTLLLECWREKEIPALADAIDLVSKVCRRGQPPVDGKNGAEKAAMWTSLARGEKPEDLERIFEAIIARSAADTIARIVELVRWPRDPRIHSHFLQLMSAAPFHSGPFWTCVLAVVAEVADPRALGGLHVPVWTGQKIERAMKKIQARFPDGAPEATAGEAEAIARIAALVADAVPSPKQVKAAASAEADLLRAIHEHPEDDQARLVYADWLLERGKPRGEFIQLQYARAEGRAPKGSATRERKLLDAGWKEWLGGIDGLMHKDGMRFERGFADTLELVRVWGTKIWERPAWSTVRVLDWYHRASDEPETREFAAGGWWRSLREMLALDPRGFSALTSSPLAAQLTAVGFWDRSAPTSANLEMLRRLPALEALCYRTRHRLPPSVIGWMRDEAVLASRARTLRLRDGYDSLFEISRGKSGAFDSLRLALKGKYFDLPVSALDSMPPGALAEVRVESERKLSADDLARVKAACERLSPATLEIR